MVRKSSIPPPAIQVSPGKSSRDEAGEEREFSAFSKWEAAAAAAATTAAAEKDPTGLTLVSV